MELHEICFWVGTVYPLPFWALMILFPRAEVTRHWMSSLWVIAAPALCYTAILVMHLPEAVAIFYKPSPVALAQALSKPWGGSLFWVYAAAFDLFVGRWIYFDARERQLHPAVVAPFLFVAIFFGPVGFLGYGCVRILSHKLKEGASP